MELIKFNRDNFFPTMDLMLTDFFDKTNNSELSELGRNFPAVNVLETKEEYKLEVALPGCEKDDFNVDVEDDMLLISSEKKGEKNDSKDEVFVRREFSYSSFRRSFYLPEDIDRNGIKASYVDGVLKLNIPKIEPAKIEKKRRIAIS